MYSPEEDEEDEVVAETVDQKVLRSAKKRSGQE
jgi:hypothetical protein